MVETQEKYEKEIEDLTLQLKASKKQNEKL